MNIIFEAHCPVFKKLSNNMFFQLSWGKTLFILARNFIPSVYVESQGGSSIPNQLVTSSVFIMVRSCWYLCYYRPIIQYKKEIQINTEFCFGVSGPLHYLIYIMIFWRDCQVDGSQPGRMWQAAVKVEYEIYWSKEVLRSYS